MRHLLRLVTVLLSGSSLAVGGWAMLRPAAFSAFVNFPPHEHFVHDIGAFNLGIGATLLVATVWADAVAVALAGYLVAGVAHTLAHVQDRDLGGSVAQTWMIGLSTVGAAVALVARCRELGWVLGRVAGSDTPAWAPFSRQKTVLLTTYRRDGTPVGTPVSIAVEGGRAYVRSFERAFKTRRIGAGAPVTVAPSTSRGVPTGPAVPATARLISGPGRRVAARALRRKYPVLHGVLVPLAHRIGRSRTGRTVHFELTARIAGDAAVPGG